MLRIQSLKTIKLLVAEGSNIDTKDDDGKNAIMYAFLNRDQRFIDILLPNRKMFIIKTLQNIDHIKNNHRIRNFDFKMKGFKIHSFHCILFLF